MPSPFARHPALKGLLCGGVEEVQSRHVDIKPDRLASGDGALGRHAGHEVAVAQAQIEEGDVAGRLDGENPGLHGAGRVRGQQAECAEADAEQNGRVSAALGEIYQ